MKFHNFIFTLCFILFSCVIVNAQQEKDSLLNALENTTLPEEKLVILRKLSGISYTKNPEETDGYINKAIFIAEETRDVELMIKARLNGARLYNSNTFFKESQQKAKGLLTDVLGYCKDLSKYEPYKITALNGLANVNSNLGAMDEGLKNVEEALTICQHIKDDSILVATYHVYSKLLLGKGEKLKALKQLLAAQNIADFTKHKSKELLLFNGYSELGRFYANIESYDKALDYFYKALENAKKREKKLNEMDMLALIGDVYIKTKKDDNAISTYEKVIALGNASKNERSIITGKAGIVNTYSNSEKNKEKLLPYLKANPDIIQYFKDNNLIQFIHIGLAEIFSLLQNKDSAEYYFKLAAPLFETNASLEQKARFNSAYGNHLFRFKLYNEAILTFKKGIIYCDSAHIDDGKLNNYQYLDSSYRAIGDFKNAVIYNDKYNKLKTELEKSGNEKDLLSLEIDNEDKQKQKLLEAEKEATKKRHNIQYMGIILGIIVLFIALITFGLFKINPKVVKWLGFISFILLFEFIILIADTWIHHLTHGEPLQILAIKVVLIALLLPFHHWIEHKVLDYITKRKIVVHHDLADGLKQSV